MYMYMSSLSNTSAHGPKPLTFLNYQKVTFLFCIILLSIQTCANSSTAKPELFGRRHIALVVLEFPIVKQRNGYPDVPVHMLPLNK